MKQKITSILSLISAVLLAVGPWTLFQACIPTEEKTMKCHWCCKAIIPIAIILMIVAVFELLEKDRKHLKALSIIGIASFAMVLLLTTKLIGGCMKPEMPCNVLAFPVINALSAVGIILQAVNFVTKEK